MKFARFMSAASAKAMLAALVVMPTQVMAQDASEGEEAASQEIIVTAQRRAERSVDVPITVTTLKTEELATANIQTLTGISKVTPALRFDSQAQWVQPSIRGIGTAVTTSGVGGNVGIYVDGFYSPNPLGADFDMMNVESVQVLKGPQGTLFGRNTTGGAILVTTREPSAESGGQVKASYGRFNEHKLQGYVTAGNDDVAFDMEALYRGGNGFQTDLTGNNKIGRYKSWSMRLGAKFNLSSTASLLLRYGHTTTEDPRSMLANVYVDPVLGDMAPTFVPTTLYTTKPDLFAGDVPNRVESDSDTYQATLKADLGFANFTSYTQYKREDVDQSEDLDHTAFTVFQIGLPVNNRTFSQEFLLTSKPGSPFQWTAGAFYFSNKDEWQTWLDNNVATVGRIRMGGSSTTSRSLAAFVDGTYEVSPRFFITGGLRYSHDKIDNAYYITAFSGVKTPVTAAQAAAVKKDTLTPRVVLRYKPSDSSSIYASYTRGFKAGILDVGGSTGNPVAPEKIDAFELGYKYDDRALSVDMSAFYYDYKNLQVSLFKGNPPSAQVINAAESEIYGLEGAVRYRVSDAFDFNLGAAWVHARYKKFNDAPVYARCTGAAVVNCANGTSYYLLTGVTLTNTKMQRTPEFTANVGARYTADLAGGKLALSGNLYYTSSFFFGPSGTQFPQKAYEVLSLRAQWNAPSDRFFLAAFGDNVTNSRYVTQAQYNNFATGAVWSAPTTWGIEIGTKF
ncbi:TonB-dependent receptor [Novosphingobium sp. TH158]|uniref:TonB-dependent receptor n=1 Tax=Novosphingobium sp. TH158 TaxID=2067455 RepID=UPI000C7D8C61|nr:TonB-dependent receptor [Novosphingobium sp. TH158]PLK26162.1 TonB-dependent receptor [Novosphingobium sp. TH158]